MTSKTLESPQFENVSCDICGSASDRPLFRGPDRLYGMAGQFTLVVCESCGTIRQNPRPTSEDLGRYYPEHYVPYAKAIDDEARFWNRWDRRFGVAKRRMSIERFVRQGSLLEVGCGTGIFLDEMRRGGWSVHGIEPNKFAAEYARSRFGIDVDVTPLEKVTLNADSYDVICLWNVFEHLPFPGQALRQLQSALKPGGLLVMSIPNLEGLDARLFGKTWLGWDLPRHLYLCPAKSLVRALDSLHLKVADRKAVAGSYHCFLISLQLYLHDRFPNNRVFVDFLVTLARQLPIRVMMAPLFFILDRIQLSPILAYCALKKPQ